MYFSKCLRPVTCTGEKVEKLPHAIDPMFILRVKARQRRSDVSLCNLRYSSHPSIVDQTGTLRCSELGSVRKPSKARAVRATIMMSDGRLVSDQSSHAFNKLRWTGPASDR